MKATFISRENNDVKFTMEFTAEEFENAQIKAYQAAKDQFQIDGFRKGKAPRSIIEKHYGEGVFFEEAIDQLFRESYGEALKELDLEVVDAPAAEFSKIAKGEGFTITITVPCFPIIAVKDYQGVEIEKVSQEVKDEDIDNELKALQKRNARMILVERPAQDGDTVLLDYSGFVGDAQFEGGTAERQELTLGSGMFIPGFEEQLVGATPGEKRDVTVTFPAEYHAEELAGKEAVFHCSINSISHEELPELDDEFVKDTSDFDTVDELKADVRKKLEENAENAASNSFENAVTLKLIEKVTDPIPHCMFEHRADSLMNQFANQLKAQGISMDLYLQYTGMTQDALKETYLERAENEVKLRLALEKVAELEKLEVSDEDLEAEVNRLAEENNLTAEDVKKRIYLEDLREDMLATKAMELVKEAAVATDAPEETEEAPAEETAATEE